MSAIISDCRKYRYLLQRQPGPQLTIIMLNPSTADGELDDPTIRRCRAFAAREGYRGISVMNLYALRSTDPAGLWAVADPVGPENDMYIKAMTSGGGVVLCAWGANAERRRVDAVLAILRKNAATPVCLGTTKHGHPRHPLYVRSDQPFTPYKP